MNKQPRFSRKFLNILIIITALAILLLSSMTPEREVEPPPASVQKSP